MYSQASVSPSHNNVFATWTGTRRNFHVANTETLAVSVKKTTQRTICYIKTEKRYNEQPTHKTAHLQAPTHKPMLQLAKEQFSCRRTAGN
jgi:hypothetical protein